ncbi:MAG: sortase, partial [Anaerolineaceae bacterium]|nr:sortase [Anaerolineaceae bacterium]
KLPPQPPAKAHQSLDGMRLEIPTLGVDTPLVGIPVSERGWDLTWLWEQAGYLNGTAFPTWQGNTAITGHVYLPNGAPGPFVNLHTLKWGDALVIHAWGKRHIYEVRSIQQTDPGDLSVLGSEPLDWITLITCQGYDTESDSYLWRLAVKAVLVRLE